MKQLNPKVYNHEKATRAQQSRTNLIIAKMKTKTHIRLSSKLSNNSLPHPTTTIARLDSTNRVKSAKFSLPPHIIMNKWRPTNVSKNKSKQQAMEGTTNGETQF